MADGRGKLIGAGALVVVAAAAVVWSVASFLDDPANAHIPSDFPHPFIAPVDNGNIEAVVVVRARMAPFGAQQIDGVERWPAWRCDHAACPGRRGDQPFVFAYGEPGRGASMVCPACVAGGIEDPTQIRPYATPEGEAILSEVRAKY